MKYTTAMRRRALPLLLAATVLFLPACDSGSDGEDFSRSDLVGTYNINQLLFETEGSAVADADVRAALAAARVVFADDGMFTLTYQFQGESERFLFGDFRIRGGDSVELDFDSSSEEGRRRMLLPDVFSLDILNAGARLETELDRSNVDLSDFSDDFGNVQSNGTLFVTMQR